MITKIVSATVAAVVVATTVGGCATRTVQTAYGPMPEYCIQNNTATDAVLATLLGAGLGAAAGRGRGAAIGAASGAALGGLVGAQLDQQCRQLALQRALEMAAAQQAAANQAPAQPKAIAYQPVEYITPTTGQRHKITPLSSYTNPATKQKCWAYDHVSYDADNKPNAEGVGRACAGADGPA